MDVNVIDLSGFLIVGLHLETNLNEFEAGIGKHTYQQLLARKAEIQNKKNNDVILYQQYPTKENFNPRVDRYVQIIGFVVEMAGEIPQGMIFHEVPAGRYAIATHKGLEKNMQVSYDYLYGKWMKETGYSSAGYDFEIWNDRYQPELPDNEIDIYRTEMKAMTCNALGGACDEVFCAETFEEMAELCKQHGMKMFQAGDEAHLKAMEKMKILMENPEEMNAWFEGKQKEFENLPDEKSSH